MRKKTKRRTTKKNQKYTGELNMELGKINLYIWNIRKIIHINSGKEN